jgi:hypothetical protein
MPGIAKAVDRARLEKSRARVTKIARYVDRKAPRLARKLAAILKDQGRRIARVVAARYAEHFGKLQKIDLETLNLLIELSDSSSLSDAAVTLLRAQLIEAIKDGAGAGIETLAAMKGVEIGDVLTPGMTEQVDAEAVFWAANRGGQLIKDLAGTTDDAMRELLSTAIDEGVTPDDLASQIEDLGAFGEVRASTIARTELAFAYVQGNVEGWRATGEVSRKRWILGDLHEKPDVCDDCVDAGDVELDAEFGDTGIDFPPAHPNCVCDVIPILSSDEVAGPDDFSNPDDTPPLEGELG